MGLVESSKAYVSWQLRGAPHSWAFVLVGNMPWWYAWAALTPIAFWLAAHVRLDKRAWKLPLAMHFGAALTLSLAHLAGTAVLYYHTTARQLEPTRSVGQQIRGFVDYYLAVNVLTYFAVIGAYYGLDLYRRYREREVAAARLETRMHEIRLEALRKQLNPHFLFNALNAVSGLVRRRENAAAVNTLARLGDLLRLTLAGKDTNMSSLRDELEFLRQYLEIERVRFGDRLAIEEEVDPTVLDAEVPTLILQPLVENAVHHGIARTAGPGRIVVVARRETNRLRLVVRDTGAGFPQSSVRREGVGLSNTRARLEHLYGRAATLSVGSGAQDTEVAISMPLTLLANANYDPRRS
jgi:LytS/YehU family sensor histidine kinase